MTWAIDEKGYSQRRACALIGMLPKTYRYVSARVAPTQQCENGCAPLLASGDDLVIDACTSCCVAKASS